MQRRNFILGLGTVATLSGAASVTGASLADSTEADADFRVIVDDAAINVVAQDAFENEAEDDFTDADGNLEFEDLSTSDDLPQGTATGETDNDGDDNLDIRLAFENDDTTYSFGETSGDNETSDGGIVTIENTGDTTESIGVQIPDEGYGSDVGGDSEISEEQVDDAFQFFVETDDTDQDISEEGDGSLDGFDIEPEEVVDVRIDIEIDSALEADISTEAGDADPFDNDEAASNVQLVEEIEIGNPSS